MDMLIHKLSKDKHRVYLLTGNRHSRGAYPHVFEKFNFSYDSGSVGEIFASIDPDVTIFFGAFDTNFNWTDERKESVRYTACLSNILSAQSSNKRGRFLYFSSQEVYGKNYPEDISEDTRVSTNNFRAMAVAQGEEICHSYRDTSGVDAVVLRYDHLYGIPKKGQQEENPCFQMILEALRSQKISANSRHEYSLLYLSDAVEFTYRIITAQQLKHPVYHISSGEVITELELAGIIRECMGKEVEVSDHTVGEKYRKVLSSSRYEEEFPHTVFVTAQEGVKKIVQYMQKHSSLFLKKEEKEGIGSKTWRTIKTIFVCLIPYIENLICFIPFFMLNNRAVSSQYYNKLDFYLLYVLLFAIVYGQQQAVFSSVLAVLGYCFRQMYTKSGFEVLLDYGTYIWIAQLFILGMVVGYMRDQIQHIRQEDKEEIQYLNGQLEDMTDINDSNVRMKHMFERQLVNQKDSLGKIYSITSELDQYGPEEVLFYAAQVLSNLMDTPDTAIYTVANGDYARLFSFTSGTAKKLGNSIKYTEMKEMYEELRERRVYINKALDERYPLMAAAIYAEDQMQIIMMLWGLPWERMNLSESNRLMIVGQLVQNAAVRASRYLEALQKERYLEGTNVLESKAFTRLVQAFFTAKRNGLTECSLLKIEVSDGTYEKTAGEIGVFLRQTDYLGMLADGLYVLLPNTDEKNAEWVVSRFGEKGLRSYLVHEEVTEH